MTIPERNLEAEPRLNPQMAIELILARQLMSYLGVPMFLVDPRGDLLFYNEAAETVLGIRFEETGRMLRDEWARVFAPVDVERKPIPADRLPLVIALEQGRPAWEEMYIQGLDESPRHLHVIGMPVIGLAGKRLGALAILWEVP